MPSAVPNAFSDMKIIINVSQDIRNDFDDEELRSGEVVKTYSNNGTLINSVYKLFIEKKI